eukprot:GHVN01069519.1.p1 GENE.GHVN01069519.1~~GHVN01069519.1.p1  ORF type:complete len:775 (-),score=62.05 GHVN01069519.1:2507-4831(-)
MTSIETGEPQPPNFVNVAVQVRPVVKPVSLHRDASYLFAGPLEYSGDIPTGLPPAHSLHEFVVYPPRPSNILEVRPAVVFDQCGVPYRSFYVRQLIPRPHSSFFKSSNPSNLSFFLTYPDSPKGSEVLVPTVPAKASFTDKPNNHWILVQPGALLKAMATRSGKPCERTKGDTMIWPTIYLQCIDLNAVDGETLKIHKNYHVFSEIMLGRGGNGEVYLGLSRKDPKFVAIKREARGMLQRETTYLQRCEHESIAKVFDYIPKQDEHDWLSMEFIEGGTLRHALKTVWSRWMPAEAIRAILFHVLSATHHMHSRGVVHRDLKSANIMLTSTPTGPLLIGREMHRRQIPSCGLSLTECGVGTHNCCIKVVDFGNGGLQSPGKPPQLKGNLTTCFAAAPEVLECVGGKIMHYSETVDIWAIGTLFYEMLTGKRLFEVSTLKEVAPLIEQFQPSNLDGNVALRRRGAKALLLLKSFLQKDPSKRIKALEALEHPYFDPILRAMRATSETCQLASSPGDVRTPLSSLSFCLSSASTAEPHSSEQPRQKFLPDSNGANAQGGNGNPTTSNDKGETLVRKLLMPFSIWGGSGTPDEKKPADEEGKMSAAIKVSNGNCVVALPWCTPSSSSITSSKKTQDVHATGKMEKPNQQINIEPWSDDKRGGMDSASSTVTPSTRCSIHHGHQHPMNNRVEAPTDSMEQKMFLEHIARNHQRSVPIQNWDAPSDFMSNHNQFLHPSLEPVKPRRHLDGSDNLRSRANDGIPSAHLPPAHGGTAQSATR